MAIIEKVAAHRGCTAIKRGSTVTVLIMIHAIALNTSVTCGLTRLLPSLLTMALRRYIGAERFTSRSLTALMAESLTYSNGDKSSDEFRTCKN